MADHVDTATCRARRLRSDVPLLRRHSGSPNPGVTRGWMILRRGGLTLEFFPYPDLDPCPRAHSAAVFGLDELQRFYDACLADRIARG